MQDVSNDSPRSAQALDVKIVVADAFDGATRLLNDVQRFGFCIRRFQLDVHTERETSIQMALVAPHGTDSAQISSRLARHGTVVSVDVAEPSEENTRSHRNVRHPAHSAASQC